MCRTYSMLALQKQKPVTPLSRKKCIFRGALITLLKLPTLQGLMTLVLWAYSSLTFPAIQGDYFTPIAENTQQTPQKYVYYFGDPTGDFTIESATSEPDIFTPLQDKTLMRTAKMHWYRIGVKNVYQQPMTWVVSTGIATATTLNAYWVDQDIKIIPSLPALSHFAAQTNMLIELQIPAQSQGFLYIQYSGFVQFPLDIQLLSPQQYLDRRFKYTLLNGMALGIVTVFLLFFGVHYSLNRRKSLAFYCLFIFGIQVFAIQVFGYGLRFFFPSHEDLDTHLTHLAGSAIYLFYFLFTAHLFQHNRRFYCILIGLSWITGLVSLAGLFYELDFLLTIIIAVGMPVAIASAIQALSYQRLTAVFFIIGSAVHYACACLLLLMLLGVPLGTWVFSLATLGQLMDIVCFSVAILVSNRQTEKLLDDQVNQRLNDLKSLNSSEQNASDMRALNQNVILESTSTAHDLQQVLASIKLQLNLLPDTARHPLLIQSVKYANELLELRINKGKGDFSSINPRQDIGKILSDASARLQLAYPSLRHKAHAKIHPCSELAINRIVDNLVTNAFKYSNTDNVLLTGRKQKDSYVIQVWDRGRGISQENLKRIMEPFEQGNASEFHERGHGLGLHIVKVLCDEFGYRFKVASTTGKGTCFSIEIPKGDTREREK